MLISFKLKNYLSFKEEHVLETAADPLKEHAEYVHIPYKHDSKLKLLKSMAIYGHNSHGKSNFLKGFAFMHSYLTQSYQLGFKNNAIPVDNFQLHTQTLNAPSLFEVTFIVEEVKYRYGFLISRDRIHEEWLFYSLPKIRENNLFIRKDQEIKINKIWNKEAEGKIDQATFFAKPKVLLLSVLMQQNEIVYISDIVAWFQRNNILFDLSEEKYLKEAALIISEPDYRQMINIFIKAAKLGFVSIEERIESSMHKNKLNVSKELLQLAHYKEIENFELYTKHEVYDHQFRIHEIALFDMLKNESAGTQKYFVLISKLCYGIKNGHIFWIDEIDSRFHALLLQLIVKLYNSKNINVAGSQMIFTSHNTTLLNRTLRRDQVLFVQKDNYGASSIFKMHSAKNPVRIDASVEKDYLRGDLKGIGLFDLNPDDSLNPDS
jgi:AAA15 family ATPase/GTPase